MVSQFCLEMFGLVQNSCHRAVASEEVNDLMSPCLFDWHARNQTTQNDLISPRRREEGGGGREGRGGEGKGRVERGEKGGEKGLTDRLLGSKEC